jgi:hypothetical protein
LKAEATGQEAVDLYAEGENKFFVKVVDAQIELTRAREGEDKVNKLFLHQNGRSVEGKQLP